MNFLHFVRKFSLKKTKKKKNESFRNYSLIGAYVFILFKDCANFWYLFRRHKFGFDADLLLTKWFLKIVIKLSRQTGMFCNSWPFGTYRRLRVVYQGCSNSCNPVNSEKHSIVTKIKKTHLENNCQMKQNCHLTLSHE